MRIKANLIALLFSTISQSFSYPISSSIGSGHIGFISRYSEPYALVKYITVVSGNVQFPTGIYNDNEWALETVAWFGESNASHRFLFGAYYDDSSWTGYGFVWNYILASRPVHGNKYGSYWVGSGIDYTSDNHIRCVVTESSCTITWNGVTRSASSNVGLNGEEIFLLGNGRNYTAGIGHGIGETIITRDGIIIAHLYPVVRKSDNMPIFYDSIRDIEIENIGNGIVGFIELD